MITSYDVMPGQPVLENLSPMADPNWLPTNTVTSDAGIEVSHQRALGHPPILQGVKILAGALAQLDVRLMREVRPRSGKARIEEVRRHPGGRVAKNRTTMRQMDHGGTMDICTYRSASMNHAILAGDGFGAIQRDGGSRPIQKTLLPPYPDSKYIFNDDGQMKLETRVQLSPFGDRTFYLDPIDVFQVRGLSHDGISGYPLTELAANALGLGMAAYKYAGKSFANDTTPSGVLSNPGFLDEDAIRSQRRAWYMQHLGVDKARNIAVLTGGTTFTPIAMTNVDAQLVEVLNADALMQSRLLNLPPFLLGVLQSSGLKMAELILFFVKFTLGDWICTWSQEMRTKLLTEDEWARGDLFFEFDMSKFLANNFAEHLEAVVNAVGGPIFTRDEGRARFKLNPATDDDEFLSRSTGEVADQQEQPADSVEQMQNRIHQLLDKLLLTTCKTESARVADAAGRANFNQWAADFYNGEWRHHLGHIVSPAAADEYCNSRKSELLSMLSNSGRGAIETDAKNYRARAYKLLERDLQSNGHRIHHQAGAS